MRVHQPVRVGLSRVCQCPDLEESDLEVIFEQRFAGRRATKAAVHERHYGIRRALKQGDEPAVLQGPLLLERL